MALPTITIVGNTTGPAELRFTPAGKAVADLTVVANKRQKNAAGEWEDAGRSPFIRVSLWGADAEAITDALDKPAKVVVTGNLVARPWEDRDGNARESIELEFATVGVVPQNARPGGQRQHTGPAAQPPPDRACRRRFDWP
jgi:single-strand DNA-binding protein